MTLDSSQFRRYQDWIRRDEAPRKIIAESEEQEVGCYLVRALVVECFDDPPTSDLVIFVPVASMVRETVSLDHGFGRFKSCPRTGNFVISTPGIGSEVSGAGPFEMLSVSLPWSTLRRSIESLIDEPLEHLPVALHNNGWHDDYTFRLLSELWRSVRIRSSSERLIIDELIIQITERLLWLGDVKLPQTKFNSVLERGKLMDVMDYIGEFSARPISLTELSQVAGCSQYHFSRLFKCSTGYSPMEYLIRDRVDRVQQTLRDHGELSLTSVAMQCGFADQSHMGRHFKRIVGLTPSRWREKASIGSAPRRRR
ncbi:MAG: AraC family transcriptional regulator [Planctomycetota bacterium]